MTMILVGSFNTVSINCGNYILISYSDMLILKN